MKLLIGLGNPGEKYTTTRHNVGHMLIDEIGSLAGYELIKTDCYMNASGRFVLAQMNERGLTPQDLVIMHDDWVFEVGDFRIQYNRSANRHNGIRSIIDALGTQEFWRVRVGVGAPHESVPLRDHVLAKLKGAELKTIRELAPTITGGIVSTIK